MLIRLLILTLTLLLVTSCAANRPYFDIPDKEPPPRKIENVRVALVLGGGGSKGVAHVGVLEVLERYGVPIDLIVGTSAGSIVGAMYADHADYKVLYDRLLGLKKDDLIDVSILDSLSFFSTLNGPVQGYYLQDFLLKNIKKPNIEDLKIPFVAVATELKSGIVHRFSSGPVALGVAASSSVPPLFTPIQAYDKIFVDGGVVEPVPIQTAKLYNPKVIIAVDISVPGYELSVENMFDVGNKSFYISYYELSRAQWHNADIIIHPNLSGFGVFDDDNNFKVYQVGKLEAMKKIPQILQKLREKGILVNRNLKP